MSLLTSTSPGNTTFVNSAKNSIEPLDFSFSQDIRFSYQLFSVCIIHFFHLFSIMELLSGGLTFDTYFTQIFLLQIFIFLQIQTQIFLLQIFIFLQIQTQIFLLQIFIFLQIQTQIFLLKFLYFSKSKLKYFFSKRKSLDA